MKERVEEEEAARENGIALEEKKERERWKERKERSKNSGK